MPDEVSPGLALEGRAMVPGAAQGDVLRLDEPLSFWGGLDPETGRIIDRHHPQLDESVVGRVLVMPSGRGSSSASSALCEAIRAGTGPFARRKRSLGPQSPAGRVLTPSGAGAGPGGEGGRKGRRGGGGG